MANGAHKILLFLLVKCIHLGPEFEKYIFLIVGLNESEDKKKVESEK